MRAIARNNIVLTKMIFVYIFFTLSNMSCQMFIIVLEVVNSFYPVLKKITELEQFSFFIYTK